MYVGLTERETKKGDQDENIAPPHCHDDGSSSSTLPFSPSTFATVQNKTRKQESVAVKIGARREIGPFEFLPFPFVLEVMAEGLELSQHWLCNWEKNQRRESDGLSTKNGVVRLRWVTDLPLEFFCNVNYLVLNKFIWAGRIKERKKIKEFWVKNFGG